MPTDLPANNIKKVKLPTNDEYEIIPSRLTDGSFVAEVPDMSQDSTLATTADLTVVTDLRSAQ